MDSGKYIDFKKDIPNTIWTFVGEGNDRRFGQYVVNHSTAGDTDSVMCKIPSKLTKGKTLDEIVEMADAVAYHINEEYPDFLRFAFNTPPDRTDSMVSNREVVADRALFNTKKRYAMHVVDDEGKRVDKLKIKGLEVIKSDTSRAVKDFLNKAIRMILDDCNREELLKEKAAFKDEFHSMGIQQIGVPMPSKKLKAYLDELEMTGSMKGFPYHYRAAIYYNSLCGPQDRKIFLGDKFYVVSIRNLESNYIAMPVDLNKEPEILKEIVIDYDLMWKKAEKKISGYLESLGWDMRSRMKSQAKDLFGV